MLELFRMSDVRTGGIPNPIEVDSPDFLGECQFRREILQYLLNLPDASHA